MITLVTFAELKTFLDLSDALESDYPDLILIRDSVTSSIESYCRRLFEPVERVRDKFYRYSTLRVDLKAYPISAVASVTVDTGSGASVQTVDTDFIILDDAIELVEPLVAAKAVITYTGGLSVVPYELTRAALLQTVYEYQNKDSVGLENISNQGGSITKPEIGLLKEVKQILDNGFINPRVHF